MSHEQIAGSRTVLYNMGMEKMQEGLRRFKREPVREMPEEWNHSARIKGQTAGSTSQDSIDE